MKTEKARWRLLTNLVLLSALLITSFQNCSRIDASESTPRIPAGVEIILEQ